MLINLSTVDVSHEAVWNQLLKSGSTYITLKRYITDVETPQRYVLTRESTAALFRERQCNVGQQQQPPPPQRVTLLLLLSSSSSSSPSPRPHPRLALALAPALALTLILIVILILLYSSSSQSSPPASPLFLCHLRTSSRCYILQYITL